MADKEYPVQYKNKLLTFLLDAREERAGEPDITRFWDYVADAFRFRDVPKLAGNEYETLVDREEQIWLKECEQTTRRRKGHEDDSEYDHLMEQWSDVWDTMLVDHWVHTVFQHDANHKKFDMVPVEFRRKVRAKVTAKEKEEKTKPAAKKPAAKKASPTSKKASAAATDDDNFEYNGEKLKRVVDAAKQRAIEVGKPDLAAAVNEIYVTSLTDWKLRVLLEAILTQDATPTQNDEFQEYVRKAKKKLKDEKKKNTSPQVQVQNSQSQSKGPGSRQQEPIVLDGKATATKFPWNTAKHRREMAEKQAREQAERGRAEAEEARAEKEKAEQQKAKEITARKDEDATLVPGDEDDTAKVDENEDSGYASNSSKRQAESRTSSEEAEDADLDEARRAAKRRKRSDSASSASYEPNGSTKKARKTSKEATIQHAGDSRDSSPLSDNEDVDMESAKEAYIDEMVRRKSADASTRAIEEEYGPISPTIAGDDARSEAGESWKSMPSPTLGATGVQDHAVAGASNRNAQGSTALAKVPSPPPQRLSSAESSHAYQLITGAAAEAVNPALTRLEQKLDALIKKSSYPAALGGLPIPASSSSAAGPATTPAQDLSNIARILQGGELDMQNPEANQLLAQLARNAAEAAISAAEAAKKAGEMARDVSLVLMHVGAKKADKQPATTIDHLRKEE